MALRPSSIDGTDTTPASDPRAAAFITLQRELAARDKSGGLDCLPETFSLLMIPNASLAMSPALELPAGAAAGGALIAGRHAALSSLSSATAPFGHTHGGGQRPYLTLLTEHESRGSPHGSLDDLRRRILPLSAHHRAMFSAMASAMAFATGSSAHGIDRCQLKAGAAHAAPQPPQVTRLVGPDGSMPAERDPLADGGPAASPAGFCDSPPRDAFPSPLRGAWTTGAIIAEAIPALLTPEDELPLASLASRSPLCGAGEAYGDPCGGGSESVAFLDSNDRLLGDLDDFLSAN